jgi:hypothetical protein
MTFLIDIWHDLREKRLWPVAVGLVAAAVAIPAIMLKPASDPAPAPVVAANNSQPETLPTVSVDSLPTHGSKLETFSRRNPFKPLDTLQKAPKTASSSSSAPSSSGSSDPTAGSTGSPSAGDIAGALGGGAGGSSGGGASTGSTGSAGGSPQTTTREYIYTVDVSFGTVDKQKKYKEVQPLTQLPNSDSPVITLLGVSSDGKSALFEVADPGLKADGEGTCGSDTSCQFVKLGLSEDENEETFTATDGSVAYDLKLLKVRKTYLDSASGASSKPVAKTAAATDGKSLSDAEPAFLPQLISGTAITSAAK